MESGVATLGFPSFRCSLSFEERESKEKVGLLCGNMI